VDLFSHHAEKNRVGQPLAERLRPQDLDEVVGQSQLIGPGRLLSKLVEPSQDSPNARGTNAFLPSLILWGPPGSGKTTIGGILAQKTGARFSTLSAVHSGVKELRQCMDEAKTALVERGQRTVLFIDEIHRYSKSQQDALLPHVESGVVTLIGATTENPSFELNAALLSRCRVLRLSPLGASDLEALLDRALTDQERGLGRLRVSMTAEIRQALIAYADGDARRLLLTLEAAAHLSPVDEDNVRQITRDTLEQALAHKTLRYDKAGEEHYDITSAFIKSMRGSDPDAAGYFMARMLESGEDPLFVLRRMVIFAGEDIGVADPRALPMAMAAVEAVRFVGMPEAVLPMSALCIFLSTAPKSNSALTGYQLAHEAVVKHGSLQVPIHLRDGHSGAARALGHGVGYKYPHEFPGHYVQQQYLPDEIVAEQRPFYHPTHSGYERHVGERMRELRRPPTDTDDKDAR
jgi:putative ATPase